MYCEDCNKLLNANTGYFKQCINNSYHWYCLLCSGKAYKYSVCICGDMRIYTRLK